MPTTRLLFLLRLGSLLAPCLSSPVGAQSLEPVGTISGGNQVALERTTTKREKGEVTATFRTTFTKPAKVPGGEWFGSRTVVSVRCADGTAAVKANRYYSDKGFKTVASEKIVKIPGYAAPVPGSVPMLALRHFCRGA
jgi:hypothetical protein